MSQMDISASIYDTQYVKANEIEPSLVRTVMQDTHMMKSKTFVTLLAVSKDKKAVYHCLSDRKWVCSKEEMGHC